MALHPVLDSIWNQRRGGEGNCSGCPGLQKSYPVMVGSLPARIAVFAEDPNYSFQDDANKQIHDSIETGFEDESTPHADLYEKVWQCRANDKKNGSYR